VSQAAPPGPTQLQRLSVLIAVAFVDMMGLMMVIPILPFAATDLGASAEMVGILIAAFSIAQLVSAPFWGRVSDRYGRRPALLIGLTASALAFAVFGLANTIWLLLLSRLVQGAGGGTTPVLQAYVADTIEPADRAKALGWLSAATSAGVTIGPVLGSAASHWGKMAPGLFAATLCLINVVFAWRWLPESKTATGSTARRKPVWHAAWEVVRHPTGLVPTFIWIYAVGMLALTCLTSVLALFLKDEFGVTARTIGFFFAYVGVLSVVIRAVVLGPVVKRFGELRTMRLGTATLIAGLLLYPAVTGIWQLALVIPLVPLGTALLFPSTTSLMSRYSDPAEVGTTMGVGQTFGGIARAVAPIIATAAFQRLGHSSPFLVAAAIVALVALLAVRLNPGQPARFPEPGVAA
jgi:multidrug resistance protein